MSDEKGFIGNIDLINTLITDCNDAVQCCVSGRYIAFCNTMVQMVQKLANLKVGVKNDLESREQTIKDYERRLAELGHPVAHFSGEEIGELIGEGEKNGSD